jgi:hypothetical protein
MKCDCEHGTCVGYLPKGLKALRCGKTRNVSNEKCGDGCKDYQKRKEPDRMPHVECCDDANNNSVADPVDSPQQDSGAAPVAGGKKK